MEVGNRPAFPIAQTARYRGLTKLEYFASAALTGFCSHPELGKRDDDQLANWSLKVAKTIVEKLNEEQNNG